MRLLYALRMFEMMGVSEFKAKSRDFENAESQEDRPTAAIRRTGLEWMLD